MKNKRELFERYKANYAEWDQLDRELRDNMIKDEWALRLEYATKRKHEIFRDNNAIIEKIQRACLEELDDELANIIYEETLDFYRRDNHDSQITLALAKVIIPYYEAKNDVERAAMLYAIAQYEILDIYDAEFRNEKIDCCYNVKARYHVKDFWTVSDILRFRIVHAYYYYLVVLMDQGMTPVKEAFSEYYKLVDILAQNEVEMEAEFKERIGYVVERIQSGMLLTILKYQDLDEEDKESIYHYAVSYLKTHKRDRKSDYELDAMEYASLLYVGYFEGSETVETMFDKFQDYFEYSYLRFQRDDTLNFELVTEQINAVEILTMLAKFVKDEEQIEKTIANFMNFAEARWIKGNVRVLDGINKMLCKVCISAFSLSSTAFNKEKSIMQLVIQRNLEAYLRGVIVSEIATTLYDEIIKKQPDYFDEITKIPKDRIREFIRLGAVFHNIGCTPVLGASITKRRKLTPEEMKRDKMHTNFAADGFQKIPELEKYVDVIRGHHKSYDGKKGVPEDYDNTKSEIRAIVDIIALAVALDEATDEYSEVERQVYTFSEYMKIIKDERNRQFSGKLVDLLENSPMLQRQLEKIVTIERLDRMYDAYHNWDKIQLGLDEASIMEDLKRHLQEYKNSYDEKSFEPYFRQLKKLAETAENQKVRGEALYYLCWYYQCNGELMSAKALDTETVSILQNTGNHILAVRHNLTMGAVEVKNESYESAIARYLVTTTMAEGYPECLTEQIIAYVNIAAIYTNLHHYERAITYYEKAEELCEDDGERRLNICCGKGYCHSMLKQLDQAKECCERVLSMKSSWPVKQYFAINVYLASFEEALGRKEELEHYLEKLEKDYSEMLEISFYTSEIFLYLELLERVGRYDELKDRLEYYLGLCSENKMSYHIYSRLLLLRIRCASALRDMQSFQKYGDIFYDAMQMERVKRAKQIEESEESLIENVRRLTEQMEMKKDKEVLEMSVREANAASNQKTAFLSSMSHEIRTPINAIIGLNEMILRESTEEPVLQYANDVHNASKQLLGIINDVLDFSKIEAGKMEILSQRYDLREFINELRNMFEPRVREKKLSFGVTCDPEIPKELLGDELRNKQIAINIIANAIKYTREGSVNINVSYKKVDEGHINLRFEVKDTGIGLKPDEIARLAIPFERFDAVNNRGIEGTGLGMSIVTKLLKQMGSRLEVSSEYGKGSTFAFEIKQEVYNWESIGSLEEFKTRIGRAARESILYAPKAEILVVDDNSINVTVTKSLLKRTGANVTVAYNGRECVEICQKKGFHLILLDHMMPEMDGVEALQKLRNEPGPNQTTAVLALTANAVSGAEEFYLSKGFDAVLLKPINPVEMERKIRFFMPDYLLEER